MSEENINQTTTNEQQASAETENEQHIGDSANVSNGTKTIHIGNDGTRTERTQPAPESQQGKPRNNGNNNQQPRQNGGNGNGRREEQNGKSESRNSNGGLNDNRLGISPTGSLYTFTTSQIGRYFERYFANNGYHSIKFVNGRPKDGKPPQMFFVFPRDKNLVSTGKTPNDIETEILGGKSRGVHLRLDQKLFQLVSMFMSNDDRKVYTVEGNKGFCYVVLNPTKVFLYMFYGENENTNFEIILLDATSESQKEILYMVAKRFKVDSGNGDLEDIIASMSRLS